MYPQHVPYRSRVMRIFILLSTTSVFKVVPQVFPDGDFFLGGAWAGASVDRQEAPAAFRKATLSGMVVPLLHKKRGRILHAPG